MLHPSSFLEKDWIDTIRDCAFEAEQRRQLAEKQLQLIYDRQWFKMLVPLEHGGKELSLTKVVQLEEALAWADGSLGWIVTLCAGAGWFGGFMQHEPASDVFSNPKVCLAGSGAVTGTAERVSQGYKVTGRWMHASGAPHATIFTANCFIEENGQQLLDEHHQPLVLSFTFLKDEVTLADTWQNMGMVATASYAYEVNNVIVPANRTFILERTHLIVDRPLYRFPFITLAEFTLVANISGMAVHFIDLAKELFAAKKDRNGKAIIENPMVLSALGSVETNVQRARIRMYEILQVTWDKCCTGHIDVETLTEAGNAVRALTIAARTAVNALYPYCGLTAADTKTEINRVWRDFHTASQHSLLVFG